MPFTQWIDEIFPTVQEPFSAVEIIRRLQAFYSPKISKHCVYRAIEALDEFAAISPVKTCKRGLTYKAEPARLIARRAAGNRPPERVFATTMRPKRNVPENSYLAAFRRRSRPR